MAHTRLYLSMADHFHLVMFQAQLRAHSRQPWTVLRVVIELQAVGFDVYSTDQSGIVFGGHPSLSHYLMRCAENAGTLAAGLRNELYDRVWTEIDATRMRAIEMLMLFIERIDTPPSNSLH